MRTSPKTVTGVSNVRRCCDPEIRSVFETQWHKTANKLNIVKDLRPQFPRKFKLIVVGFWFVCLPKTASSPDWETLIMIMYVFYVMYVMYVFYVDQNIPPRKIVKRMADEGKRTVR